MNTACIEPSAKNLLNKLGILSATKNISATMPAPKYLASIISLNKPKTLLNKVQKETFKIFLIFTLISLLDLF